MQTRGNNMADIADITEADESATSKAQALANVAGFAVAYFSGRETYGVLSMYEEAAVNAGCRRGEVDAVVEGIRRFLESASFLKQGGDRG